jgi:hypothetical protein
MNKYWTLLQLNKEKELFKIVSIFIVAFALTSSGFFWFPPILMIFVCIIVMVVLYGVMVDHYHHRYQYLIEKRQQGLMYSFSLLKVLLFQGLTPYQALKSALDYIPNVLYEPFSTLLLKIDSDKSIAPYVYIAQSFQSLVIEQLFFSIYQLEGHGGKLSLHHFQYIFDQSDSQFHQKNIYRLKQTLQSNLSLALLGTGLLSFSLLVGIIGLIGEIISGI